MTESRWNWKFVIDEHDRVWLDGDQSIDFNRLMDLADPIEDRDAVNRQSLNKYPEGVPGNIPTIKVHGGLIDSGLNAGFLHAYAEYSR